ncbi:MAG: DUF1636 domain-containing protein [Pseudomonadota bacterium]
MVDGPDTTNHIILICTKCRGGEAASVLRAAIADGLPLEFAIRAVDCMAGCDHPTTVGFQARGKATYLFGDIDSLTDIAAVKQFAHQYLRSTNGWTSATDRPLTLYNKTLARMPAHKPGGAS